MRREDLIAFAQRDRPAIEESKAAYWLDRKRRLGRGEAFRVAEDLRRFAAAVRPGWPDAEARAEDFATHVAVGESLRRVDLDRPR